MRKGLESEELFTQMMEEEIEFNPSTSHDPLELCSEFIKCEVEHISIVDGRQTESIAVKEELPDVCDTQDDIIEPKEEYQSDDLEPENLDNTGLDKGYMLPHISDSDSESDVPLMKFKIEVEEHDVEKQIAEETNRRTITQKAKLDTRRSKQEDTITAELEKNEQSNLKLMETTQNRTSRSDTYVEMPDPRSLYEVEYFRHITRIKGICEKKFKCGICQQSFSRKDYLITHIRIHTGEKPFKCNICKWSFTRNSDFKKHVRTHPGEKPFKCDVCQHRFNQKRSLITHIRTHTGEKPFKCDVCQRSFNKKTSLITHIRTHTGEKPFKCDICQRNFASNSYLRTHIRIHTGEKPYKCDVCQRSFRLSGDLKSHMRKHTGEKPYKCDVCPRSFKRNEDLRKHVLKHSSVQWFKSKGRPAKKKN